MRIGPLRSDFPATAKGLIHGNEGRGGQGFTVSEAILGFLGVGVPPYVPSWGNVIASGKNVIREAFWVSLFPGLALTISGLSLNLLGDGLRDTLDPRLKV